MSKTKNEELTEVMLRKVGHYRINYIGGRRHMQLRRRALDSMGWKHRA